MSGNTVSRSARVFPVTVKKVPLYECSPWQKWKNLLQCRLNFVWSTTMARVCEICGKGRSIGNSIETRGKAKYLGGVGTKVTGITRRTFLPNLQNVRTTTANGTTKTVRICTQCVRSGAVRKQIRNVPFKVTHDTDVMPLGSSVNSKKKKAVKAKASSPVAKASSPAKK